MTFDPNSTTTANPEVVGELDFSSFADEPSQGALPAGWYKATVIEGYATKKSGYQFFTGDFLSKNGDSRNLRICFALNNGNQTRNLQEQFNYRSEYLLTVEGLDAIKEARATYKPGSWPGHAKVMQSSSITLGRLGQLQKAIGHKIRAVGGQFDLSPLIGQMLDVRVAIDENDYNAIREFAPLGTKSK